MKIESRGPGWQANIAKVDLTAARGAAVAPVDAPESVPGSGRSTPNPRRLRRRVGDRRSDRPHARCSRAPCAGPAYLVSHGGAEFPDVEFVLQGEGITLVARRQDRHQRTGSPTSQFEAAPDAPFTSFETELPAGPHSALTANVPEAKTTASARRASRCPPRSPARTARVIEQDTHITVTGCAAVKSFEAKKLTLAQQLATALTKCRSTYKHNASKRAACERKAHATYTAKALAECRKSDKHSSEKLKACEAEARRAYGARVSASRARSGAAGRRA